MESTQEKAAAKFLEPIQLNPLIVSDNKRHPIDRLSLLPTRNGFSLINGDDRVVCEDFSLSPRLQKSDAEGWTEIATYINDRVLTVDANGQVARIYVFNQRFSSPWVERLGGSKVEDGTYFIVDSASVRDRGKRDALFMLKDDLAKTSTGIEWGTEHNITEEESQKYRVSLGDVSSVDNVKRVGDYLLVAGHNEKDVRKLMLVDQQGQVVFSEQVGFKPDRIVTNGNENKANKFIIVNTEGTPFIYELRHEDGGRLVLSGSSVDQKVRTTLREVCRDRKLVDIALQGDEIYVLTGEKGGGKKELFRILANGQIENKKMKDSVVGVSILEGSPYSLQENSEGNQKYLEACLVTGLQ